MSAVVLHVSNLSICPKIALKEGGERREKRRKNGERGVWLSVYRPLTVETIS